MGECCIHSCRSIDARFANQCMRVKYGHMYSDAKNDCAAQRGRFHTRTQWCHRRSFCTSLKLCGAITLDHLAFYRAFLCCRPRRQPHCAHAMATNFPDITLNSTYGSPDDYAAAIEDLRAALSGDAVSVEPTVLEKHGKSIGELKTGMSHPRFVCLCMLTSDWWTQGVPIPSSCSPSRPRTSSKLSTSPGSTASPLRLTAVLPVWRDSSWQYVSVRGVSLGNVLIFGSVVLCRWNLRRHLRNEQDS